jgi:single-stranded DNA-binding protein
VLNVVARAGEVADAAVKIASLPSGQPEAKWTLVLEEPRQDGQHWKRFIPVVAYGGRGEALAASLKAGDLVTVQGCLCWRTPPPTKSEPKPAGRLDERDMGP